MTNPYDTMALAHMINEHDQIIDGVIFEAKTACQPRAAFVCLALSLAWAVLTIVALVTDFS